VCPAGEIQAGAARHEMESVGAFGSVLPLLVSRGLLQQQRVSDAGGGSSGHGSHGNPHLHTDLAPARRVVRVEMLVCQKAPTRPFPNRAAAETYRRLHPGPDRGVLPSPHQARRRGGLRSKSTRQNTSPQFYPKMPSISTRRMKNPKHAGNEQLESNLSNLARISSH
jgi:hypothetical protein